MRRSLLALALVPLACSPGPSEGPGAPLLVAAASDLQEVMPGLIAAFREGRGGDATATFGPSGRLAAQIEAGAPVDVFLSADEGFIRSLAAAGLLEETTLRPYARGRLALLSAGGKVEGLGDLKAASVKKIAMANPDHAPYGRAAREALQRAGLWEDLRERIVLAESVRQAQQFVESGNAEAGLVSYATARGSSGFVATPVEESLYTPLVQWLGVVKGAPSPGRAGAFAEFMTSGRAREILERAGFAMPPEANAPRLDPGEGSGRGGKGPAR